MSRTLYTIYCLVFTSGMNVAAAEVAVQLEKLALPPSSSVSTDISLGVAYDCLAALALYSGGTKEMRERARTDGDMLLTSISKDKAGRSGWPYIQRETEQSKKCGKPGSLDAFSDGTCNPPETPYMIQTGYAITCLAQLNIATGNNKYLNIAERAIGDSWNLGITPTDCKDCFYYWYSYDINDKQRFVRNTNVIMGLGLAWMYAATGKQEYKDRALAIARAEEREIKAGNFGYFGIDDVKYHLNPAMESQQIENHFPHQIKGLKDIGMLLSYGQALDDADTLLNAFLNCTNDRCRPNNCNIWAAPIPCRGTATIAPCILADRKSLYKSQCQSAVNSLPHLNDFQIFLLESVSDKNKLRTE